MESVSLKLDELTSKKIDELMKKYHYATKTEFIRESIRKNINSMENNLTPKELAKLRKYLGYYKDKQISDNEFEKIREEVGKRSLIESGLL